MSCLLLDRVVIGHMAEVARFPAVSALWDGCAIKQQVYESIERYTPGETASVAELVVFLRTYTLSRCMICNAPLRFLHNASCRWQYAFARIDCGRSRSLDNVYVSCLRCACAPSTADFSAGLSVGDSAGLSAGDSAGAPAACECGCRDPGGLFRPWGNPARRSAFVAQARAEIDANGEVVVAVSKSFEFFAGQRAATGEAFGAALGDAGLAALGLENTNKNRKFLRRLWAHATVGDVVLALANLRGVRDGLRCMLGDDATRVRPIPRAFGREN